MIMNCCNLTHLYDRFDVEENWQPREIRCLIVGEKTLAALSQLTSMTRQGVMKMTLWISEMLFFKIFLNKNS